MDDRVQEILDNATDIQQDYVMARLVHSDSAKAARSIGMHKSTPRKWANLDQLEKAVHLMRLDIVASTKLAIEGLSHKAAAAVGRVFDHGSDAAIVSAAKAIWDRMGLPAMSHVDVTSKGEQIKAHVYIPDNGRQDRD